MLTTTRIFFVMAVVLSALRPALGTARYFPDSIGLELPRGRVS